MEEFRQTVSIDHLVLGSRDLEMLSRWWSLSSGEPAVAGGAHTGRGTRNELVGLGPTTYLELIGPDPDQPPPDGPRPFGVDLIRSSEPVLVTFAVAVSDIEAARESYRLAGVDTTPAFAMERLTPSGDLLAWRLSMPDSGSGTIPFLIEWGKGTNHPAQGLSHSSRLMELGVAHPNPQQTRDAIAALSINVTVAEGPIGIHAVLDTPNGKVDLRS